MRRRTSDRTKKKVYRFRVRFGREKRSSRLLWLSLGLGDHRRSISGSGDVSLTIFITSVSGRKSPTSFTNRIFHLSRPPGFRMAFDAAERNGRFGRIQCQRSKETSSRGKRRVFLCRRTMTIKVNGKVNPSKLSENEITGNVRWGERPERKRQSEKSVGDQSPNPEAPPRSKIRRVRREQRKCQWRSDCQWIDGEE